MKSRQRSARRSRTYRTNITIMTALLKIRNLAAGLLALLACFSCSMDSEFDTRTCDGFLSCYYTNLNTGDGYYAWDEVRPN